MYIRQINTTEDCMSVEYSIEGKLKVIFTVYNASHYTRRYYDIFVKILDVASDNTKFLYKSTNFKTTCNPFDDRDIAEKFLKEVGVNNNKIGNGDLISDRISFNFFLVQLGKINKVEQ